MKAAPHGFGMTYANFAAAHLAPALKHFLFAEWDEAKIEGLDASAYRIVDGKVVVPNRPGFGLDLDDAFFRRRIESDGWTVGNG